MISSLNDIDAVKRYLSRIGAEARSLRTAVVRENHGDYWKDVAIIRFSKSGEVLVGEAEHLAPTEQEAAEIIESCKNVEWPELQPLKQLIKLPQALKKAKGNDLFIFRNIDDEIVMVQLRVQKKGEKAYLPFTYWSDGLWRNCEPEGKLPLFNAEKLKGQSIVFIHEGAKAARAVQTMVEAKLREDHDRLLEHPWCQELQHAVHLGWTGGALSPQRTDWSVLKAAGVQRVYIVADNDHAGLSAVPAIARELRCLTFLIQFTDEFPKSFDLADPFPEKMFATEGESRYYIGPSFRSCQHPATWATDLVQVGKGRPTAVLRDSFKAMWAYVEETDLFVCREMPEIVRNESILNKKLAPFSHVKETSQLIVKAFRGVTTKLCYRPDEKGLVVTYQDSSAINMHVPSSVRPQKGDTALWEEFLHYLFVHERERHEAQRWIATLIARPDIRMGYGMLLISERQGIGKTTLGSAVLAPLVGLRNTGFPGENDITGAYNHWVAMKRLAIISEIYSGSSWKSYHVLKGIITDKDITVNEKYQRQFVIENWCHVLACSNSMRALKMENDDRRWFYPELAEVPWSKSKFEKFRKWLDSGGLSIIKHWAESWKNYVSAGEIAPMTERKSEMIDGSRSEAQREAAAIAEAVKSHEKPIAIILKDVVGWCRQSSQGRIFDTDYEIRKAMVDIGLIVHPKRIKVGQRLEYLLMNERLRDEIQRCPAEVQNDMLRKSIVKCNSIMGAEM